jgi:hypothetical protein
VDEIRQMLATWFSEDELDVCERCGEKHLMPAWGSADGIRACIGWGPSWLSRSQNPSNARPNFRGLCETVVWLLENPEQRSFVSASPAPVGP